MEFLISKRGLIISLWIEYLWEQYLCYRQYALARRCTRKPPELRYVMTHELYNNKRSHMMEEKLFGFQKDFFLIMFSTIVILYDILPTLWKEIGTEYEVAHSLVWYCVITISYFFIRLPWTTVEIIESKILFWKKLKNFVVMNITVIVLSPVLIGIINMGDHALIGTWAFICSIVFLVGTIYPMIDQRLFRNVTPLGQGTLKTEIGNLASQMDFPLNKIYIEQRLENDSDPLYIYGTFKNKSIVLKPLLWTRGCTRQHILALVAHKLAGWHYKHTFKYLVLLELRLFLSFAAFFFLFRHPGIYKIFGFHETRPVFVGVYVVLKYAMALYSTLLSFCFMYFSRKFVTDCDEFVVNLGRGEALAAALLKIKNREDFPVYDHLYSLRYHHEPTVLERVRAINNFIRILEGDMEWPEEDWGYILFEPE